VALSRTKGRSTLAVRVVMILATAFAAWHVFAQFLWIAPPSQLRTVVPGNLLTQYEIPLFGQSWSVFAPDPINGDYHLQVRAIVASGKEATTTPWVDATEAEHLLALHNLFPPRAANLAVEQASRYSNAYNALNADQKKTVGYGFYKGADWSERYAKAVRLVGGADDASRRATDTFLAAALRADAYSTQVARTEWGQHVVYVQTRIYRQNIVPFAERFDAKAVRPPKQNVPTGWRGPYAYAGQSASAFAAVFRPLAAKENR
jgi:hypothetical protein